MSIITVNDQAISNRLQEIIKEKRIKSVRAFALSVDVDPSYMAKVIKCERSISEAMVDSIAEKYNILPDWLIWGKGDKYGQYVPQTNSLALKPVEPDIELKYVALLEKNDKDKDKIIKEQSEDLNALRSAIEQFKSIDSKIFNLESTVHDLKGKFQDYEPTILGLREFVTAEIAALKKKSHESVAAALNIKVEEHRKAVERSYIQKD